MFPVVLLAAVSLALAAALAVIGAGAAKLARMHDAQARMADLIDDLKARVAEGDRTRDGLATRLDALRDEKEALSESLAGRKEAVRSAEASILELRERLACAEQAREAALIRLEASLGEKAKLEKAIGEEAALATERTRRLEEVTHAHQEALQQLEASRTESGGQVAQIASLREAIEQERKRAAEKLQLLDQAKAQMTGEFKLLADEIMSRHGESFTKQNKEQIDQTLTPLRERLSEFQKSLQDAHNESERERVRLAEQIKTLSETSASMTHETRNLTQALRGKAQTQGAWGEMILGTILEKSGLREGEEFTAQEAHTTADGKRLRPDVIVNLPGGQRIVIDAKVSLTAFEAYVAAETDEQRDKEIRRHLASMRQHISLLASKEYHAVAEGSLDYVVMFVPIEGALAAALDREPDLTAFAVEHHVYIATPTTLMIALRTASNVWHVERRNRNAEAIADRAGKAFDKFCGFLTDMQALDRRLNEARGSFDGAMAKLSRGRGNAISQLQQLKDMGARTNKTLPPGVICDEGGMLEAAVPSELSGIAVDYQQAQPAV